jgi:hypothetical protein
MAVDIAARQTRTGGTRSPNLSGSLARVARGRGDEIAEDQASFSRELEA